MSEASLKSFEILLGVSGGIAAYKAAELTSQLVQAGAGVTVAMTPHALHFVGKLTFGALTGREVCVDLFEQPEIYDTRHIEATCQADLLVVAPATANFLAKAATGISDDLLSTLFIAHDGLKLIAPAMNHRMWAAAATRRNVATLKEDGCVFVGPEEGTLACRETGPGRLAEPEQIAKAIFSLLSEQRPRSQE